MSKKDNLPEIVIEDHGTTRCSDPFDRSDPRSIINLLGEKLQEAIAKVPPSYWELGEEELYDLAFYEFRDKNNNSVKRLRIPPWIHRLRLAFWEEYDRCQRTKDTQMDMANVYPECCSRSQFFNVFIQCPEKLAWLLTVPPSYRLLLADIHTLGLERMREILELAPTKPDGTPDAKLIDAQARIFQHVDMRKKGAIIQRIDQRNLNVNVDANADSATAAAANKAAMSMGDIEYELAQLDHRSRQLRSPGVVNVDIMKTIETVKVESSDKIKADGKKVDSSGD